MKLDHINIKAPAELLDREKQFFLDLLGLTEGARPAFSSRGYWLYAEGKPVVHLSVSDQHYASKRQGYFDHVAFRSSGLGDFLRRLDAAGVEHNRGYVEACNMTQIFLRSPTGTRIEVNFVDEYL